MHLNVRCQLRYLQRAGADRQKPNVILGLKLAEYEVLMREDYPGEAPNLTSACVFMFGVNITWVLIAIWAVWGLVAALLLGWSVDKLITRMQAWSQAKRAAAIRRGKPS